MNSTISFQVRTEGVIINLNPDASYDNIRTELINHVNEADDFFSGVDIYLNITGQTFNINDIQELMEILNSYSEINDIYILSENGSDKNDSCKMDTLLIKRTIRSGQRVKYPTNVVIMGDVNPGAVVIAGGDIIVLGRLKGVVHAGAEGSTEAKIFAQSLQPTQLRIANIISRSPDDNINKGKYEPEIAYLKDGKIIVEKY